MQERYLFRGKRIDTGEWVKGYYFKSDFVSEGACYIVDTKQNSLVAYYKQKSIFDFLVRIYEVDPSTICQGTGLKDKNGKLIWENDIVSFLHEKYKKTDALGLTAHKYIRNYVIEFENTFWNYGFRFRNKSIHFRCTQATLCTYDCEVIGNVFDNPELLEGSYDGK